MESLLTLPPEIQTEILVRLEPEDIPNVALSCRAIATQIKQDSFWRHKIALEFGEDAIDPTERPLDLYRNLSNAFTSIAQNFDIAWLHDRRFWAMTQDDESIFPEVATLKSVCWMDMKGSREKVPPGTYRVYWGVRFPQRQAFIGPGMLRDDVKWRVYVRKHKDKSAAAPAAVELAEGAEQADGQDESHLPAQNLVVDETFPLSSGSYAPDDQIPQPDPRFRNMPMRTRIQGPPTQSPHTPVGKGWIELKSRTIFTLPHGEGLKDVLFSISETSNQWKANMEFDYVRLQRVADGTKSDDIAELAGRPDPRCWIIPKKEDRDLQRKRTRNLDPLEPANSAEDVEEVWSVSGVAGMIRSLLPF